MDPILNCILGVCCDAEGQLQALTMYLTDKGVDALAAESCATVMLASFDLAPHGSLGDFKKAIAELARGENFKKDKG